MGRMAHESVFVLINCRVVGGRLHSRDGALANQPSLDLAPVLARLDAQDADQDWCKTD